MDIFTEYFSECTEHRIKDNYVIVYEVGGALGHSLRMGIILVSYPGQLTVLHVLLGRNEA